MKRKPIRPEISKERWKEWDDDQRKIMRQLQAAHKKNKGLMGVTLHRALEIARQQKEKYHG